MASAIGYVGQTLEEQLGYDTTKDFFTERIRMLIDRHESFFLDQQRKKKSFPGVRDIETRRTLNLLHAYRQVILYDMVQLLTRRLDLENMPGLMQGGPASRFAAQAVQSPEGSPPVAESWYEVIDIPWIEEQLAIDNRLLQILDTEPSLPESVAPQFRPTGITRGVAIAELGDVEGRLDKSLRISGKEEDDQMSASASGIAQMAMAKFPEGHIVNSTARMLLVFA